MAKQKLRQHGSVKRFGVRYGRTVREKIAIIEKEQRKGHKCPYCMAEKVKRVAAGIWMCKKCKAKFTGKAYTTIKKVIIRGEEMPKEIEGKLEEKAEEKEVEA